jgi:hypothetical protein
MSGRKKSEKTRKRLNILEMKRSFSKELVFEGMALFINFATTLN